MKRLLAVVLALSVAACGSQQRPVDDPDFTAKPGTTEETPDKPRLGEIESLISQAKLEIRRRDYDEARVKLHQVFRRDRWNPEANTVYQDLQISRGQGDALYQEYLDLYEANKQRGDALWFHLRPLLIKRGIKACEVEKHEEPSEEARAKIKEIEGRQRELGGSEVERIRAEIKLIDEVLALDPMNSLFVQRRAYLDPQSTLRKYQEAAEENPGSGDALYLHALVVNEWTDGLEMLRKAWILELPGVYLRLGIADLARLCAQRTRASTSPSMPARPDAIYDEHAGYLNIALTFYAIVALSDQQLAVEASRIEVLAMSKKCGRELDDLSVRK